jgi:protein SCO1/2
MEHMTRRTAMAMGALPVLGAAAAYAGGEHWLRDDAGGRPRFARTDAGSARAALQQRDLPNVPLLTSDGDRVRFYDDLVKDRKVVLTFVSSRAPAFSSTVTRNLAALQRLFGTRIGKDLFLYSIARDPERDSPAMLRDWAVWSGAGPGWTFLTGRPADVERLRRALGFVSDDPAQDARAAYAVGLLRYGSEPEMRWAHCQSQAKARVLAHAMLLDFGTGPADPASPIFKAFVKGSAPGAAPVWNCRLLLSGLG